MLPCSRISRVELKLTSQDISSNINATTELSTLTNKRDLQLAKLVHTEVRDDWLPARASGSSQRMTFWTFPHSNSTWQKCVFTLKTTLRVLQLFLGLLTILKDSCERQQIQIFPAARVTHHNHHEIPRERNQQLRWNDNLAEVVDLFWSCPIKSFREFEMVTSTGSRRGDDV